MMTTAATPADQSTAPEPVLHLAFELGQTRWKLGFTTNGVTRRGFAGAAGASWMRCVAAETPSHHG